MYDQIKLIDGISNFSPTRERWVSKPKEDLPDSLTITFKTGQTGRLDLKDPLSAHWANMIDEQSQANQPVYVEIDEETSVITNVLVPRVFTVKQLETDERDNLLVHLHQSSAIHAVLHSDPDFAAMRDSLQIAMEDGSERLITCTRDDLEIIDVRTPTGNPSGPSETPPPPTPDPPVTPDRATQIFNDMNSETCAACNPSSTCIPFLFPDDGCWIRAHLMAYDMRDYTPPEDPEKIYIQGSLDPFVPNHPDCRLPYGWGWHIAPTLMVTLPGGDEKRVIDPSLASAPVSETEWKNLNNPLSTPTLTPLAWTVYNPVLNNTATDAQAQSAMQYYRNALKTRCLQFGPPPYSCIKNLFFILDRNTFSDDEIEAMLLSGSPARVSDAFYVVLDGYSPNQLGFTTATMQHQPALSISPSVSGMTITADRIEFEYPNHLNRRQRLTWVYHIDFTDISGFTSNRRTITVQAMMDTETGSGTLYLIRQANPYEVDGSVSWLSTDLRVFQIKTGETRFAVTMGSNPNDFITQVITKLNNNTAGQTFESISTDQQTSRLELSGTVGGVAVYNFAIAKVRYRSADTDAQDVRVFFRLFPWATTSVEYNLATEYRRYQSGNRVVPLLGKKNNEVSSIPCFASPRINTATADMTTQTDAPNVQNIAKDTGGAEVSQYFGCWLDINQSQQTHFPYQFPATDIDGPYSNRMSVQDHIRNEHQCLVSEIAFLPAPAQNGTTPSKSDKLAQRNLAIVKTTNPGINLSRRIPQTFEIQPSASTLEHDELMIDWGNVPVGSMATVYLPGIDSREILTLASRKYRHHRLKRIDEHTIKFETGGISYLPIPFSDNAFPGLLTVDLPEGIKTGQAFNIVVRQVTGVRQQYDLRRIEREKLVDWRHIVGSFQLTIPVRNKADILPAQQRLLSNLRWIKRAIPVGNRWVPVFSKYVAQIADRVDALGGDSSKVAPSASGQWQQAHRTCRLSALISALLIAGLVVVSGTQTCGLVVLGGIPLVVLLACMVYLWRNKCRPTNCQLLRALLAGSGIGAIILALLAVFGTVTSQLITTLIVSAGVAVATAIVSWVKGCFR
ncbi:MAG: hypothetical protein GY839_10220 [candidate division Zixibacteria bacterium]|nr:hypothetical protein [candidate division Zixibacteria bacterium]